MNTKGNYKKGNRIEIIKILYAAGCLPYRSLRMLPGSVVVTQRRVLKMRNENLIEIVRDKRNGKRITLSNNWRKSLNQYDEYLPEQYILHYEENLDEIRKINYQSEAVKAERLLKQSEACLMMHLSGIGSYPDERKILNAQNTILDENEKAYFPSREIKKSGNYIVSVKSVKVKDDKKKVAGSRIHGLMVSPGGQYAVYNIGNRLIEWERGGEVNMSHFLSEILNRKYQNEKKYIPECLLLGENMEVFSQVVLNENKRRRNMTLLNIDYAYETMYAVPADRNGIEMLKLMTEPDWQIKMKALLLAGMDMNEINHYSVACDAMEDNAFVLLFCIPDISKLKMFLKRAFLDHDKTRYHIYCFSFQLPLIAKLIEDNVTISAMELSEYTAMLEGGKHENIR